MSNTQRPQQDTILARVSQFVRKNWFSILVGIAIGFMLLVPDAKSWVLRQFMATGLFNAAIEKPTTPVSDPVPDFRLVNAAGKSFRIASLRGKVVFINFWASWCPPCRAEFPSIEKLYQTFRDHPDVVILTINEDQHAAAASAYMDKENFTVPFYKAVAHVPAEIYSGVLPTTVVLDKDGALRYRHEGFANYASESFMNQIRKLAQE